MVPAIRQIGHGDIGQNHFFGKEMIPYLNRLRSPSAQEHGSRKKFDDINRFLQTVTGNRTAKIKIPHDLETINVEMDEKLLPLDSLGTGIQEVIILATAATVLDNTVICMEEPELHLNPLLQKKLVRYLEQNTNNQYFISTHSASLMDTPNAEVYHIKLQEAQSVVERVSSDKHRSEVCEDLGYHPSDLLQTNCVIWVEGPSDRIYLNHWLKAKDPDLVEGTHYSIMFYGGRLQAHISGNDPDDDVVDDFISLRRLNRRGVIVIDSDRAKKGARINQTKSRLKDEFDSGPGYAWITDGREVENYLPTEQIKGALNKVKPTAKMLSKFGRYDNTLTIKPARGKNTQAPKVAVAKHITNNEQPDFSVLELGKQIDRLVEFIRVSNCGA